jgi:hypothetical protein
VAERPIFVPARSDRELVEELYFDFDWHSGLAPVQKEKNIRNLHAAAASAGYKPLLEVSSKSGQKVGRHLSAFHLTVHDSNFGDAPLESVFQGSKVFERGGPYTDLYKADARTAKTDARLKQSGRLIAFSLASRDFPLEPKTAFYDWLYINAIFPHREWLARLRGFAGFTDIEFNPAKSINCQARSCALFVALLNRNLLDGAVQSPSAFLSLLTRHSYHPDLKLAKISA